MEGKVKLHGIFLGPISVLNYKIECWVNTTQIKTIATYYKDDNKTYIITSDKAEYIADISVSDLLTVLEGTLKESNKTKSPNFY